jgi:hypothetical protein
METTKKITSVNEEVCTSADTKYPARLQKAHNAQNIKQQHGIDIMNGYLIDIADALPL